MTTVEVKTIRAHAGGLAGGDQPPRALDVRPRGSSPASRCEAISAARCTTHSGLAEASAAVKDRIGEVARDRGRARRLGARPADQREHLVPAAEELRADRSAEEAARAGDEDLHGASLRPGTVPTTCELDTARQGLAVAEWPAALRLTRWLVIRHWRPSSEAGRRVSERIPSVRELDEEELEELAAKSRSSTSRRER